MMKKKILYPICLCTVLLAASCKDSLDNSYYIPAYSSSGEEKKEKGSDVDDDIIPDGVPEDAIKAISFNVRNGNSDDGPNSWEYRKKAVPNMLYKENPTIFGLQEAQPAQLVYIRQQCPHYKDIGVGREDGRNKGEHMSIFYDTRRVTLESWGTFWLSETPDKPSKGWTEEYYRSTTWAIFNNLQHKGKFFYMNTHGPLDNASNANAMVLIADKLRELNPEGYPAILTGDFNAEPDSRNLQCIRAIMKNSRETAEKTDDKDTFNGFGTKGGKADFVWHSGFRKAVEYRTITDKYKGVTYISDHYPVTAVLELDDETD